MAADVSLTMELQAKQLFNDLQAVQGKIAAFAGTVQGHGDKAGKGFASGVGAGVGGSLGGLKSAVGGLLGGLGIGLGVGAIVNKFEQVIEKGSRIHDIAAKFHIDAEQLQLIGNAAEQDGVSLEKVAGAMNRLQIAGATAAKAGSPINKAVKELAIDAEAFAAASPAEKFFQVGEAYQKAGFSAESYAAAAALVGKKNTDVLVTMEQTRTAIEKVSKEFGILGTAQVNALDKAGDSIKSFNNKVTLGFAEGIKQTGDFGSALEKLNEKIKAGLEKVGLKPNDLAVKGLNREKDAFKGGGGTTAGGAGSSWGVDAAGNPAPNEDMIAEAITGTSLAGTAGVAAVTGGTDEELAQRYLASQGLEGGANVNMKQAAEFQRQKEAQDVIDAQIAEANAADDQSGMTPDQLAENVRAGELEGQLQTDLAEQEMSIANWDAGETLLTEIRDAIANSGGNL